MLNKTNAKVALNTTIVNTKLKKELNQNNMAKKTFGENLDKAISTLEKAICYENNVLELLRAFKINHVDVTTGKLKVASFEDGVELIQDLWNKIKETALECENKEIKLDLGDSTVAGVLKIALGFIGFEL